MLSNPPVHFRTKVAHDDEPFSAVIQYNLECIQDKFIYRMYWIAVSLVLSFLLLKKYIFYYFIKSFP